MKCPGSYQQQFESWTTCWLPHITKSTEQSQRNQQIITFIHCAKIWCCFRKVFRKPWICLHTVQIQVLQPHGDPPTNVWSWYKDLAKGGQNARQCPPHSIGKWYLFHWRPWVFVNCKLEFGGPGGELDADLTMPHPPCNQLHTVKAPSLVGMAPVFNAFKVYSFMPARVFFLNEYRSGQTAFPAIKDWFRGSKQDMLVSSIASRAILLQHTHWKQNALRRCQCSSAVSFPCIDYCFVPRQLWPAEAFSLR